MNRFDALPHIAERYAFRSKLYENTGQWPDYTIQQLILRAAETKPEQKWTFLVDGDDIHLTLADLVASANDFAQLLLHSSAPTPDDVVAVLMPNSPGGVTGFYGSQLAGLPGFPLSMREGAESLADLWELVRFAHVVVGEQETERRAWIEALIADGRVKHLWLADAQGRIRASDDTPRPADIVPLPETVDGVHVVAYTSGSTSVPKVVLHTDAELINESYSLSEVFGFWGTMLAAAPIGHITGILHVFTVPLVRDGDIVSIDRWSIESALDACRRFGAETIAGTSLYYQQLMTVDATMGGIKGGIAGGGPVAPVIVERADREAGIRIVRSYGSTEHPTPTQSLPDDTLEHRALTDGSPNRGVEVRILDSEGNEVPRGQAGEVVTRGPDAMAGYLDPELDAEFYTPDGWFHSSDVGRLDEDGYLTITDRIKDLIIRAGENISAKEVEDIIHQWAPIEEAVVVGVPDATYGERGCAFVIAREEGVTIETLTAFLASTRLEKFKWPEYLEVVDDLPRTPAGKVSKKILRERWADASRVG